MGHLPPQAYLIECFDYNPETGRFFWKERPLRHFADERAWKIWNARFSGKEAFVSSTQGYKHATINSIKVRAHRVAFKIVHGWEPEHVDHDDHNRANNAALNLKASDATRNAQNKSKAVTNVSGITGVHFDASKGKWRAMLGSKRLGTFTDFDEAVAVRKKAQAEAGYHPSHGK